MSFATKESQKYHKIDDTINFSAVFVYTHKRRTFKVKTTILFINNYEKTRFKQIKKNISFEPNYNSMSNRMEKDIRLEVLKENEHELSLCDNYYKLTAHKISYSELKDSGWVSILEEDEDITFLRENRDLLEHSIYDFEKVIQCFYKNSRNIKIKEFNSIFVKGISGVYF